MKRFISIFVLSAMILSTAAGCGNTETTQPQNTETVSEESTPITGTVTMNGSTSMEKLCNALNEGFMLANGGVTATVEFTGSGAGIESVTNGTCDIGNSSRALKEEELANGLVENIVAIDGIGIVVDTANTVEGLSTEQLVQIYTGEVTNWSQVGGADSQIVVIGREASSGTRGAFEELLEIEDMCKYAQEIDSTGAVMAKVASTPGAIGYVSIDVLDDTVKAVKVNDVEPTAENIKAGTYTMSRPFVMATKGEISAQSEAVQAFFEYIDSEEGQAIIQQVGLISAK